MTDKPKTEEDEENEGGSDDGTPPTAVIEGGIDPSEWTTAREVSTREKETETRTR